MTPRSIASLSLSFGLVSIPVKLYSATDPSAAIRFKLMAPGGVRLRQQYVAEQPAPTAVDLDEPAEPLPVPPPTTTTRSARERVVDFPAPPHSRTEIVAPPAEPPAIVERSDMVKGYEFDKGQFVLFTADELKALEEGARQTIDIVSFVPDAAVDPLYYDKPYFLAPAKGGAKPYSLLLRAMRDTGRSALAKWAWRSKEYVVQIRAAEGGLVLQQLLYADEVRSIDDLGIELVEVGEGELKLARQLIERIADEAYDPTRFVDEEKQRILAAVERKIEGRQIVAPAPHEVAAGSNVVSLMEALRASLLPDAKAIFPRKAKDSRVAPAVAERRPVKRASSAASAVKPARTRSHKK